MTDDTLARGIVRKPPPRPGRMSGVVFGIAIGIFIGAMLGHIPGKAIEQLALDAVEYVR